MGAPDATHAGFADADRGAMVRVLQWVAWGGVWRVVMVTTRLIRRAPIEGFRADLGASFCNPARPRVR